jgi:hypothetical protein
MECRRCGRELPVGQRKTCPYCGIYLETIVTPRGARPKGRRPTSRATLMTFLSVGFVFVAVFILVPFMRSVNKQHMLLNLEETFLELDGRELEFSEDDWQKRLATFTAGIENFKKAYPSDHENIEDIERKLHILLGLDPDDPTRPDPTRRPAEQDRYNYELINRARDEIIDITEILLTGPEAGGNCTVSVRIKNSSEIIISQVTIFLDVFDEHGNPSNGSKQDDNKWYIRTDAPIGVGKTEHFRYIETWRDPNIANVKITWVIVEYGPTNRIEFPPAVCEVLWP